MLTDGWMDGWMSKDLYEMLMRLQAMQVSTHCQFLPIFQKKNKGIIMVTFNADVLACGRKAVNVSTLAGLKLIYCSFHRWLL